MSLEQHQEYEKRAREQWGQTGAWREYEEKNEARTEQERKAITDAFMQIFSDFGKIKNGNPESDDAKNLVRALKNYISEHFYTCTDEVLKNLGQMYVSDPEFKENIDEAGGEGTANFVSKAIRNF